jgi:hypothetical protein
LVLGPDVVPLVRDRSAAAVSPELAVLSVMLHGHDEAAAAAGEVALAAVRGLDDERADFYTDLVLASVHGAARAIEVPDEVRSRITGCSDLGLLDRWLARAVTALAAVDVVRE